MRRYGRDRWLDFSNRLFVNTGFSRPEGEELGEWSVPGGRGWVTGSEWRSVDGDSGDGHTDDGGELVPVFRLSYDPARPS
jgi:hypothetical protein